MNLHVVTVAGPVTLTGDEIARAIQKLADAKTSPIVEQFIAAECYEVAGAKILFTDFYARFLRSLVKSERREWTRTRVAKAIPARFPYGRHTGNRRYIGNLSWHRVTPTRPAWTVMDGLLRPVTA
ncbi:MAG TPA: hypothetical protein VHD36_12480 [Pirellulales bacterium]|nr:hypothetical protein [Pirellulales bacterium]